MPRGPSSIKLKFGLYERGEPGNEVELDPGGQLRWFQADGAQQDVYPVISGELLASLPIRRKVEPAELNRAQVLDVKGVFVGIDVVVSDR